MRSHPTQRTQIACVVAPVLIVGAPGMATSKAPHRHSSDTHAVDVMVPACVARSVPVGRQARVRDSARTSSRRTRSRRRFAMVVSPELWRGHQSRVAAPTLVESFAKVPRSSADESIVATRGRVLIIDDDMAVCRGLVRLLQDQHEIVIATDGADALAFFKAGRRFDAILCDYNMPRMSGAELHDRLLRIAPDQVDRLIFVTAQSSSVSGRMLDNQIIEKPFSVLSMRSLVGRVVDASEAGYFPR
jgi:CheY-like chemotaxis protein